MHIHSAAVLGAGTMGAQIAAHLANAGLPVLLLDLDRKTAAEGLRRAQKLKPDPFFTRDAVDLITLGSFDADLPRLNGSDWIIEARFAGYFPRLYQCLLAGLGRQKC